MLVASQCIGSRFFQNSYTPVQIQKFTSREREVSTKNALLRMPFINNVTSINYSLFTTTKSGPYPGGGGPWPPPRKFLQIFFFENIRVPPVVFDQKVTGGTLMF